VVVVVLEAYYRQQQPYRLVQVIALWLVLAVQVAHPMLEAL
jgi:hypothetical protein